MKAALRFGLGASAFALALAAAPLLAQEAPPATNTPATDSVGPRELQNFSIEGTVTREAEEAPVRAAPRPQPAPTASQPPAQRPAERTTETRDPPAQPRREPAPATGAAADVVAPATTALPPLDITTDPPATTPAPVDFAPHEEATSAPGLGVVPWLLALALLVAGVAFVFWRQRSGPALAHAGVAPRYAAPATAAEPQPLKRAPAPEAARRVPPPAPRASPPAERTPPTPAQPVGLVATRLRPWLDIQFVPGRCIVDDEKATIEFEVTVLNSGSAPARNVLVEARLFNAGPAQDQEIGAFFASPVGQGERVPVIPQLKSMTLKSVATLPREQIRIFEVEGRRLLVPLIGFNALYNWSSGEGQTSASYLLGRDNDGEKLAPLRLDLGPRVFRGLGFRTHTLGVRK